MIACHVIWKHVFVWRWCIANGEDTRFYRMHSIVNERNVALSTDMGLVG